MKRHRSHSNGTRRWERVARYKESLEERTECLRKELGLACEGPRELRGNGVCKRPLAPPPRPQGRLVALAFVFQAALRGLS